jgi:hypothetical protein
LLPLGLEPPTSSFSTVFTYIMINPELDLSDRQRQNQTKERAKVHFSAYLTRDGRRVRAMKILPCRWRILRSPKAVEKEFIRTGRLDP